MVWNLQLTRRVKIGLGILLSLSIFAAVASIVKTVELKSIGAGGDITHNLVPFVIWFTVENNVVIAAASVPTIRPLFVRKTRGSKATGYGSEYQMQGYGSARSKGYVQSQNDQIRSGEHRGGVGRNGRDSLFIVKEQAFTVTRERRNSTNSRGESEVELSSHAAV